MGERPGHSMGGTAWRLVARVLRCFSVRREVGVTPAVRAVAGLALAMGLVSPAGPALAAGSPDVQISGATARVAAGTGQARVILGVDNPNPSFSGWVEIGGVERRTLAAVEVSTGRSELRVWVSPGDSGGGLSVGLLDSSERPVSSRLDLPLDHSLSILVVGSRSADYSFLADVLGMDVERAASFPTDPREYDLYAAVVLAEPDQAAVARAAGPLLDWTRQGGLLVWAVGGEGAQALPEQMSGFVPAAPLELVVVGEATPIFASVMGSDPVPLAQPGLETGREVTVLAVTDGQAHLTYTIDDGSVIMAAASEGLGQSAVAGLVPTGTASRDAADTGLSQFWQSLLAGAGPPVPAATTSEGPAPHGFVTGHVPSLWLTVGLSVGYVAVVGVGLFAWLRRLRRRDAVWWALPLLVVACTVGVLAAGLSLRGPDAKVVTRLNAVAPADGTVPALYRAVGVYAPFGAEVGLVLPETAFPGPTPAGGLPGLEGAYTVRQHGTETRFEGVGVAPGSGRTVIYGSLDDEDAERAAWPWRLSGRSQGDGVAWTVTNTSDHELRRVTVLADGLWSLPDLSPGDAVRFTLGGGRVTGGDARRVETQPVPVGGDDLVEWDASRRLRDEWWMWGAPESSAEPAIPVGSATGVEVVAPPVLSPTEARVLAWADDERPAVAVEGIPPDAAVRGIVVYEAVLR